MLVALSCGLLTRQAAAGAVSPLQGSGNFHATFDIVNQWRDDGRLDVVVMVAVANRELSFERLENGRYAGRVRVEAHLSGFEGGEVAAESELRVMAANGDEVGSATLFQVFPLVLEGVDLRAGRLDLKVEDLERGRPGVFAAGPARSETAADWAAPTTPRVDDGITVGDPLFLASAPIGLWRRGEERQPASGPSTLLDYMHPTRRYGLEQSPLQLYFELHPGRETPRSDAQDDLFVQIYSRNPEYALRDTVSLDPAARQALSRGETAGVFYELDVNILPPGTFQLGVAPLSGRGRGVVAEFAVIWRLALLNRHADELMGEGRTVLRGDALKRFQNAGMADRELMLEQFWHDLDPDPETAVNETYLEFRRRVAFVRERLGGFDRTGALDPRGELYLLLGHPDVVEVESIPLNADAQDDARIKVYERYAPDRTGSTARGDDPAGSQGRNIYDRQGGIPMPFSMVAQKDILSSRTSSRRLQAYELWEYENEGQPLFPNKYSEKSMGLRFLFVDRTGTGYYVLESSNALLLGD